MGGVQDTERRGHGAAAAGGELVLGTKLRLAAAGMTDVGRRRERNQDNTTHYVPGDERTLAEKGALFVVCDGMGGHAAGEVASEIGVNTIRDEYYADTNADVITGIAHAIKSANERIFGYAHEHPEMAGMGTTCVTLLIHGGRAYLVNIGDSRAYLVRGGSLRQVTLDHSWVAEQVRAGVLTDEQARTHAHRNVITRSLGTQPTVNADLFVETLHDGDRLLLCSDGLHGYVDEREIEREMVQHVDPELGVRALIDMANENGGPDNITAVVVHMLEVPPVIGELSIPNVEDKGITQPLPAVAAQQRTQPKLPPAALETSKRTRRGRGARVALVAVRLLAAAALVALAAGIWDFTAGPYSNYRATVARTQSDIANARKLAGAAGDQQPAQALTALAAARDRLVADVQSSELDDQTRQGAQAALTDSVAPAVASALKAYDTQAGIVPVALGSIHTYSLTCGGAGAAASQTLTFISALVAGPTSASSQTLYALSSGRLFQLTTPLDASGAVGGSASCMPLDLPAGLTPTTLAIDGGNLFALAQQGASVAVLALSPDTSSTDNSPKLKADVLASVQPAAGETPTFLAVSGDNVYVASQGTLWQFAGQAPKQTSTKITLPTSAKSLVASGADAYVLFGDGSVAVSHAGGAFSGSSVIVQPPLTRISPTDYNPANPVPVPVSSTGQASTFGDGAVLRLDPSSAAGLIIGDSAHFRVVRLTAGSGAGSTLLARQYVYDSPVDDVSQLALSLVKPTGGAQPLLIVYFWSGRNLVALSLPA